jgi:hypothetical protein
LIFSFDKSYMFTFLISIKCSFCLQSYCSFFKFQTKHGSCVYFSMCCCPCFYGCFLFALVCLRTYTTCLWVLNVSRILVRLLPIFLILAVKFQLPNTFHQVTGCFLLRIKCPNYKRRLIHIECTCTCNYKRRLIHIECTCTCNW